MREACKSGVYQGLIVLLLVILDVVIGMEYLTTELGVLRLSLALSAREPAESHTTHEEQMLYVHHMYQQGGMVKVLAGFYSRFALGFDVPLALPRIQLRIAESP